MKKLFIRLFVAFLAFSFGLVLTNFLRPKYTHAFDLDHVVVIRSHPELRTLPSTEDESQILQIYRGYGPAQTRHDHRFFQRIETEDFTLTIGDRKLSREEDLQWMDEQSPAIMYESRVDHLRVFGSLAIAHGYLEIRYPDEEARQWPFVDVWVKRDGEWRIQSTTSR